MPVVTSRTSENAKITIDQEKCVNCGLCARVCINGSMVMKNGKVEQSDKTILGCFACGQCVAVCPKDAIMVEGRCLSRSDFSPIVKNGKDIEFNDYLQVVAARRSIRHFDKNKPVTQETLNKIIEFASFAPPSITPPEIELLVLNSSEKVRDFSFELIDSFKKMKMLISPLALKMMKPFMGTEKYNGFATFIAPWMNAVFEKREKNENWLLYDAPAAMFFYSSLADNADTYIAATYAMIGAEALGLGSCMIGSIAPMLGGAGNKLRNKYRITSGVKSGLAVIFGYPENKYRKTIKRTFKSVRYF